MTVSQLLTQQGTLTFPNSVFLAVKWISRCDTANRSVHLKVAVTLDQQTIVKIS